jgi:integrase
VKPYPYVSSFLDRHGRRRWRFRRAGARAVYLPGRPGEPAFDAAYAAALAGAPLRDAKPGAAAKPGTVAALIAAYYRSPEYLGLAASTRATYRRFFEPFRAEHGEKRVATLPRQWIRSEMARRAANPAAANWFLRHIRMLMNFAVAEGWREASPCAGIRRQKSDSQGFRPWGDAEIAAYAARWTAGTRQRLAMDLLLYTGQRRSDVVRMTLGHIRQTPEGPEIRVRQQKTGAPLWLPLHPALQRSIAATPRRGLALIETAFGKPFSAAGFSQRFVAWALAAGIPAGFSAHGLRKAAGARLAETGASTRAIMAVLGHKSLAEAERYTASADQRRLARAAIARLGESERG